MSVKHKEGELSIGRHSSAVSSHEQELCNAALLSGQYDNMTDEEWVAMCERIAHKKTGDSAQTDKASIARGKE